MRPFSMAGFGIASTFSPRRMRKSWWSRACRVPTEEAHPDAFIHLEKDIASLEERTRTIRSKHEADEEEPVSGEARQCSASFNKHVERNYETGNSEKEKGMPLTEMTNRQNLATFDVVVVGGGVADLGSPKRVATGTDGEITAATDNVISLKKPSR